jgi:membrane protease YdiL (CAAX protease family)
MTTTTTSNSSARGNNGDGSRIPLYRNPLRLALSASPWRSAWCLAGHLAGGTILGALIRAVGRWRDPAIWRDLGYLTALWLPLALLDVSVLTVWGALLIGVTLPFWYWLPAGTDAVGYVRGRTVHGIPLGYFPHGPAGRGAIGLYIDTLPKAVLAAAFCVVAFLLFNYVLVRAARTHAAVAQAVAGQPSAGWKGAGHRHDRVRPAQQSRPRTGVWPTLGLYLLVTWLAAGALKELQPITHLPSQVLSLTQFAPSIAVLVVLARHRGAALQIWQGTAAATLRRIAAGAGILAAVFGLALAGLALAGHAIHLTSPWTLGDPFWLIVVAQLVGACGEELGWRCFLQPHLQQRYSPVCSALIVGALWGTWHVEYLGDGLLFFAVFIVAAIAISVILARLIRGVSSLAVAGVSHWLLNLAILLLLNFANGSLAEVTAMAAGFVVAAIVVWSWPARTPALLWPSRARRRRLGGQDLARSGSLAHVRGAAPFGRDHE